MSDTQLQDWTTAHWSQRENRWVLVGHKSKEEAREFLAREKAPGLLMKVIERAMVEVRWEIADGQ